MKYLYKYPQAEYPYELLVEENAKRTKRDPEFELIDTGVFNENRYFDVFMEYAKASPEDILIKITAWNRGPDEAQLDLLPTLWFRNIWSFGEKHGHPRLWRVPDFMGAAVVAAEESRYGKRWLLAEAAPEMLFTENETNFQRVFGFHNETPYVKDSFHDYLLHGAKEAVNPAQAGTKCAAHHRAKIAPGASTTIRLRLTNVEPKSGAANPLTPISKRCSTCAAGKRINSTRGDFRRSVPKTRTWSCARRLRACCGPSSAITMTSIPG